MKKFFVIATSLLLGASVFAQSKWFKAQSKSASVKSVTATSELVEAQFDGKYLYPPINILDGDFNSTWCEADQKGSGIGESITVEFAEPVSFDEIQIVNGFVSKDYYLKNNRVKTLRLTQVAKEHFQQKDYTLKDNVQDWQSIKFDLLQTAQTLTLEIRDVYRGSKYDDTCLDDIRLLHKGKVIPFENVGEIKLVQRENSKAKIKLSELDFKIQLLHLGRSIMHRFGDGKLSGLRDIVLKSDYDGEVDKIMRFGKDGELEYIAGCTIIDMKEFLNQKNSNKNEYYWMQYIDNLNGKDDDYDYSKYSYAIGYYYPSYWGNNMASFTMSNSRIITTRQIDYVEVTTANLIKLDGNSVYIDGVKYTAIDPALCLDVRLDDGY